MLYGVKDRGEGTVWFYRAVWLRISIIQLGSSALFAQYYQACHISTMLTLIHLTWYTDFPFWTDISSFGSILNKKGWPSALSPLENEFCSQPSRTRKTIICQKKREKLVKGGILPQWNRESKRTTKEFSLYLLRPTPVTVATRMIPLGNDVG